ncbi:beta-1,6-N-acetylglucosaminyltransferase, partial [Lactobacillus helveticus]
MGKHAYLIIANRNPNQLNLLLKTIDDSRNDIYLLIDKKSINNFNRIFKPRYSILTMVDPLNIFWGDYSLISAELRLFSVAKSGNYDYYHLLSGLDLPLVNQDIIHSFFDKYPN